MLWNQTSKSEQKVRHFRGVIGNTQRNLQKHVILSAPAMCFTALWVSQPGTPCPASEAAGSGEQLEGFTCQKKAFLHSQKHPAAPWRDLPAQAVGKGLPPSAPAVGWNPHTAPPAWEPGGSHSASRTGQCLPASAQKYLHQKQSSGSAEHHEHLRGAHAFCYNPRHLQVI